MKHFDPQTIDLSGTKLIEASAGTGKTYSIALLVLRLIVEKEIPLKEILVVTYTKAAAAELKARIRNFIAAAVDSLNGAAIDNDDVAAIVKKISRQDAQKTRALTDVLHSIDEASIFTIHGFCQRILDDNAFETGTSYGTEMITDQNALIDEIAADFYRMHISTAHPVIVSYIAGEKFGIKQIREFIFGSTNHPLAKLTYSEDNSPEKILAMLSELKEFWIKSEERIKKELSIYPKITEEHFRSLNALFSEDAPDTKAIEFFSSESIGKMTDHKIAEYELCQKCDKILERLLELTAYYRGALYEFTMKELLARKSEKNIQYYDDLLMRLYNALCDTNRNELIINAVRKKYKAAFIDEFQDTDPVQYFIFDKIFGNDGTLFLIGDPKQSIYGFRGADIFTYMNAAESMERFTLSRNYRSESGLVDAFNSIFSIDKPFLYKKIKYEKAVSADSAKTLLIDKNPVKPLVIWNIEQSDPVTKGEAAVQINDAVASEIISLLTGGAHIEERPVTAGDIAVLTETWYYAANLKKHLAEKGIHAVVNGEGNVFASDEAYDMFLFLRAVAEPSNEKFIRGALVTDLMGYSFEEIIEYNRSDSIREKIIADFRNLGKVFSGRGFAAMLMEFQRMYKIRKHLMSLDNGERRLTNFLHLGELLHQESRKESGIHYLLRRLSERIKSSESRNDEHMLRLESDESAVKLITVHGSKGLEYPIVFCPFLWGEVKGNKKAGAKRRAFFYHEESDGRYEEVLHITNNPGDLLRNSVLEEEYSEKLRLFYVALTRAVHRCYIAWGKIKDTDKSSSAYFRKNMERLAESPNILITEPPASSGRFEDAGEIEETLRLPQFTGTIPQAWKVSSFSAMSAASASAADESPADHDGGSIPYPLSETEDAGIFAFPKGARPGSALHEVFELISFASENNTSAVEAVLNKYNLSGESGQHIVVIEKTVRDVLRTPLPVEPAFCLADIADSDKKTELEFYFSVKDGSKDFSFLEGCSELEPFGGYMHGFIDLVFRKNGIYYLADWKSNYLGGNISDYNKEALHGAMIQHKYNLQYMVYTLALHRYLQSADKNYSCDKN
ncbi:MAG: exodeoxyribonuclease V subunit beta, partial [Spirochaetia bacterium]|nr:exodeoxyribonuclease V subunit beta [Spirochaetia bacterium]